MVGVILLFGGYPSHSHSQQVLWQTSDGLGWAMVALAVTGFLFAWWARVALGKLWSGHVTRKEDHHVVDRGPYAVVRHPIYTGIILASFATAVARGTALAFAGALIMTVSWYIKARLEENFLREQLGADNYDAYARRVPMLIPFVNL
jgi:protein-S-isoprenylcysteine O-methyltransferase Ste14